MIDFHAHLLPGIDDGSRNLRMTAAMLRESERQGIEISVATPHLYFDKKISKMISKRQEAYDKTMKFVAKTGVNVPEIVLGFEVHLCEKILTVPNLDDFLIDGTNTMLVELPRKKWDGEIFDRLDFLMEKGYDIVIAHPERYFDIVDEKGYDRLFSYKVAGQINAASLVNPIARKFACKMIEDGRIQVMGSDSHNVGLRANFMAIARDIIKRNLGAKYIEMMDENAEHFLGFK